MKRIFLHCSTQVRRDAVRRETREGVEHIVISSHTLPDNVVMNGGLYTTEEVDAAILSLNRTLAPVEHPVDANGRFISATDPQAIHEYYAGAFNENVRREGDRIALDKVINVPEAQKSDRGKRLLDRVVEIETNSEARPIHTSVGVFVGAEDLDEPRTNAAGDQYTWIARGMVFDHDAILLDSVGAAQPHQGVGIAVNNEGDDLEVHAGTVALIDNASGTSFSDINDALRSALELEPLIQSSEYMYVEEVFSEVVVFTVDGALYEVPYRLDGGRATLVGIPLPVERKVTYSPKTNQREGDPMRELMINALKAAGIQVNQDISDESLLTQHSELQAKATGDDLATNAEAIAAAVTAAVEPIATKVAELENNAQNAAGQELDELAELVGNNDKFPGLGVDAAKKLDVDTLKNMAANCQESYGLASFELETNNQGGDTFAMPE